MASSKFETQYGSTLRGLMGLALALVLTAVGATAVAAQNTGTVTGLVRDAVSLEPLAGAQVSVAGTGVGGLANNVGRYLLLNVPAGQQTINVQLIGYSAGSQTVTVTAGGTTTADFGLREQALSLEGVIVTGTAGAARRREIGNQISQVTAADIEIAAVTDMGDVLQGRTTGVQINDHGGQVGGGSQIRLRGNSSLTQGDNPLIYVDGVRIENGPIASDDEAGQTPSAFDMINPADIDRIEIVKGPAATTLYGTEAAGGVIQIFTKRGSSGAPAWTLSIDQGISNMGHQGGSLNPKSINPRGFNLNDCSGEPGCPESGSWFKTGYLQRYNLSVRGGGETATYFVSGRWGDEQGVVDPQGAEDYSVRANVAFQPFDGLDVSLNNSYSHRTITWIPDGNNASGLLLNVMRGTAGYTPGNDDSLVLANDLITNLDQFVVGASVGWTPNSSWAHRLNAGMDYTVSDAVDYKRWDFFESPTGDREDDQQQDRNLTLDYNGSFNFDPTESINSRFSWGGQLYEEFSYSINGFDDTFAGPGEALLGDGNNQDVGEGRLRVRSGGFFLQEALGFQDKLFLTGGVRWDGFSTFGEGFGLAAYPKISASYLISDESFFPDFLEQFKLRAAWGQSGKAPGAFDAAKIYEATSADEQVPAVVIDNLGNPDLGPEISTELEFGFEATAMDGRIALEFTRYDQTTKDALIGVSGVPSLGTNNTVQRNLGEVKNWGMETGLTVVPVRLDNLEWQVGVNYSSNDSEVTDLGPLTDIGGGREVGYPLRMAFDDVLQNPGLVGVEPELADEFIGRLFPTDMVGLSTRVTFNNALTLDLLVEGQFGMYRPVGHAYQSMRRLSLTNTTPWPYCLPVLQQWLDTPGPTSNRVANSGLTTDQMSECIQQFSDQGVWTRNADFIRGRSATLAYRLPDGLVPGTRSVQLSVQGKNLFTITDYIGLDPEAQDNGFGDTTPNDYYTYGPPRHFIFSATVNF